MIRCEDLGLNGLKIKQDSELFCFGTDSVLLSDFAKAKKGDKVVDLCSGNGIIPILMSEKTKADKFYCIEILKSSFELLKENISLNRLEEKMTAFNEDINEINSILPSGFADVVTCNPPYRSVGDGFINPNDDLAVARHEIKTDLKKVIKSASSVLKFGGHFYMVHRADRLCDVLTFLREEKLEPKRIAFIHPSPDKAPNLIMTDAMMGANPSLIIEKPIYVNI